MSGRNGTVVRSKFGYVAQRFSLYRDLTVEENIRFFGGACRVPRERTARPDRALARADRFGRKTTCRGGQSVRGHAATAGARLRARA